ncbi:hypothetical protein QQ045_005156 [Rhodiola kirilowii]
MPLCFRSGFGCGFELQRKQCRKQTPRFGGQRWEGSFVSNQEKQVQKIPGSNTWLPCKDEYYQWKRSVVRMSTTSGREVLKRRLIGHLPSPCP